jgi:hypothetical protein
MHSRREPDEPAALGLGPAFLLVEAGVLRLGMRGVGRLGMRRVSGLGMRRQWGIFGANRRAREDKREKGGNGKSLRGSHGDVLNAPQ